MIRSMTGYGRGENTLYNRKFSVEIKSVNHRYSDITVKLPRLMNPFEDKVRKKAAAGILRGKADVFILYEALAGDDVKIGLNAGLADAYAERLREIRERYSPGAEIPVGLIAAFPDVITVERASAGDEDLISRMWEALEPALDAALAEHGAMRAREGEALKADILEKRRTVAALLEKVRARAPLVADESGEKLRARLAEALGEPGVDQNRLVTEITLMADRACVDEEITRLESHLAQLEDILGEADPVGRKLDFLVQEMNREVNTIGSKANDLEITKIVVDMKSEVEKIREQVQNIE